MASFIKIVLIIIMLIPWGFVLAQEKYIPTNYGFLKTNLKPFYIYSDDSISRVLINSDSYFNIANSDSAKFEVIAYGFENGVLQNTSGFIDSSKIELIKSLPLNLRKTVIKNGFKRYKKAFDFKIKDQFAFYLYESVYSPMRREFIDYWVDTKDSILLLEFFDILEFIGGSIDGLDSKAVAHVFMSAPFEFCEVLRKVKKERKLFIKNLLGNGIAYYTKTGEEKYWLKLVDDYLKVRTK